MRRFLKPHFFFYVFVWTVLKSLLWRAVSKTCGYVNQPPETERRGFVNSPTETTSLKALCKVVLRPCPDEAGEQNTRFQKCPDYCGRSRSVGMLDT